MIKGETCVESGRGAYEDEVAIFLLSVLCLVGRLIVAAAGRQSGIKAGDSEADSCNWRFCESRARPVRSV
jgi:hypothetical protein